MWLLFIDNYQHFSSQNHTKDRKDLKSHFLDGVDFTILTSVKNRETDNEISVPFVMRRTNMHSYTIKMENINSSCKSIADFYLENLPDQFIRGEYELQLITCKPKSHHCSDDCLEKKVSTCFMHVLKWFLEMIALSSTSICIHNDCTMRVTWLKTSVLKRL